MSLNSCSNSAASASADGNSLMSLSKLHVIAVVMIVFTMDGPRPESFKVWYEAINSFNSFNPLYKPAFSAGGVR